MSNSPSPSEDLSFLRSLAESGRDAPLMAGPYLIAGGGWFAAASLIQWLPIREFLGLAANQATIAWLVAAAGFAVHLAILIKRDRSKVENTSNRAVNAAWTAIGFGIFAFWMGTAVMAYQRGDGFLMNMVSLQVLSSSAKRNNSDFIIQK